MTKNLYFVESIFTPREGDNSVVTLLPAESEEMAITQSFTPEQLQVYNHRGSIREGWYVYYNESSNTPFGYGNLSTYARRQFRNYYELRESLSANLIDSEGEDAMVPKAFLNENTPSQVTSYHVNVGHGNCSFILIEAGMFYQLWLVDCSVVDKTNHWKSYQTNIDECLKAIRQKLGLQEKQQLHIDRFFLTHAHHDHYSGVEYLVKSHLIDNRTICYVNLYYQMATKAYNRMLTTLKNTGVRIIEPISGNSINGIQFLHPECRLYRSKATVKGFTGRHRIVGTPINNSSVVLMLSFGGHSMVFTGDLEQKGFENMSGAGTCSSYLYEADYYVVSHHGSMNGHPAMACKNPLQPKPTPLFCATNRALRAILMGRDGAYPGIYSPVVTSYWNGTLGGLVKSEDAPHFVELDWGTAVARYI